MKEDPRVSTPRLEDGAIHRDEGTGGDTDRGEKVNPVRGSLRHCPARELSVGDVQMRARNVNLEPEGSPVGQV